MEISVIIPAYNAESYIERCIESLLKQTFRSFECIIVNDGSQDSTQEKCQRFSKTSDISVVIINKENTGVSDCRNIGIRQATGKWICFVDADDYCDPTMLEKAYMAGERGNADIVQYGYSRINKQGSIQYQSFCSNMVSIPETFAFEFCLWSVWSKLIRRKLIIEKNILFSTTYTYGEDLLFSFYLFLATQKVAMLPSALYFYCENDNSIVSNQSEQTQRNDIEVISEIDAICVSRGISDFDAFLLKNKMRSKMVFINGIGKLNYKKWRELFPEANKRIADTQYSWVLKAYMTTIYKEHDNLARIEFLLFKVLNRFFHLL